MGGRARRTAPVGEVRGEPHYAGLVVTDARIGETWRIGEQGRLPGHGPRIPCATFAVWMNRKGWLKEFTCPCPAWRLSAACSAAGDIQASDPVVVESGRVTTVTVGTTFRALTLEPDLLRRLLEASEYLDEEIVARARDRDPWSCSRRTTAKRGSGDLDRTASEADRRAVELR